MKVCAPTKRLGSASMDVSETVSGACIVGNCRTSIVGSCAQVGSGEFGFVSGKSQEHGLVPMATCCGIANRMGSLGCAGL